MKQEETSRQIQYLATMLALVGGYYAIRASLQLPKFREMFVGLDASDQPFSLGMLIIGHPYWYLALVVAALTGTLLAIWKTFRIHNVIYPIGIGLQFFLADRAVASAIDPIIRMISTMGNQ
jgi:hypothetical protein